MRIGPQRPVNPDAVVAPPGYRVEALITGLTFPSAISFGPGGELYLAEGGGVGGSVVAVPRVLRIDPDQSVNEIGRLDNPIVGLVYRNGELLIAEDGPAPRILRVTAEGEVKILVENLPGGGDYGISGLALDASGALLFGLGTRTNSGVVGLDNVARGWVSSHPEWADVPGADVELTGVNYVTSHSISGGAARVTTGAFRALGQRSEPGETVPGSLICGGAIYRVPLDSPEPERVAWGLRNPICAACGPEGALFVTEGGMEERGSRPIAGAPDNLWQMQTGGYYGWPDHASGIPVTDPRFRLPGHPQPRRLLNNAAAVAGTPSATFEPRSGVGRFDFSSSANFGFAGELIVALAGGWSTPAYAGEDAAPAGHRVVRVDPRTGEVRDFLTNRSGAPASHGNTGGLERPFDVCFDPTGEVLYVVDLGEVRLNREYGLEPFGRTGVVWRITRIRPTLVVPESAPAAEDTSADESPIDVEVELIETLPGDVEMLPEVDPFDIGDEVDLPEEGDDSDETDEAAPDEDGGPEEDAAEAAPAAPAEPEVEAGEAIATEPEAAPTPEPVPDGTFASGGLSSEELPVGEPSSFGSDLSEEPPAAPSFETAEPEAEPEAREQQEPAAAPEAAEVEAPPEAEPVAGVVAAEAPEADVEAPSPAADEPASDAGETGVEATPDEPQPSASEPEPTAAVEADAPAAEAEPGVSEPAEGVEPEPAPVAEETVDGEQPAGSGEKESE